MMNRDPLNFTRFEDWIFAILSKHTILDLRESLFSGADDMPSRNESALLYARFFEEVVRQIGSDSDCFVPKENESFAEYAHRIVENACVSLVIELVHDDIEDLDDFLNEYKEGV